MIGVCNLNLFKIDRKNSNGLLNRIYRYLRQVRDKNRSSHCCEKLSSSNLLPVWNFRPQYKTLHQSETHRRGGEADE